MNEMFSLMFPKVTKIFRQQSKCSWQFSWGLACLHQQALILYSGTEIANLKVEILLIIVGDKIYNLLLSAEDCFS